MQVNLAGNLSNIAPGLSAQLTGSLPDQSSGKVRADASELVVGIVLLRSSLSCVQPRSICMQRLGRQ